MTDIHALLQDIDGFAAKSGMSPEAICRAATNNPRLYDRLKTRCEQTVRDSERIRDFIAKHSDKPARAE